MSKLTIRPATIGDLEVIVDFNARIASETEDTALDRDTLRDGVRALLGDPAKGRYFVACMDDDVVGQIMHTREWSDWRNGDIWWIQSVYVHADHRRRGVFASLYRHLQQLAEAAPGVVGLRLYVEVENAPAQATYTRLGMDDASYRVMQEIFR